MPTKNHSNLSFEKTAKKLILVLLLATAALFFVGKLQDPKVHLLDSQNLSPKTQKISWEFTQEMDVPSVEQNFLISPQKEGTFSWAGRKLVFSLDEPLGYEQDISISISGFSHEGKSLSKTSFNLKTPGPLFAFIDPAGSLFSFDVNTQSIKRLTPNDLEVLEYEWSANGDKLAFLANKQGAVVPQLFTVDAEGENLRQWTDSEAYLNLAFAFAPNGESVLLDRVERDPVTGVPGSHALWEVKPRSQKLFWYPGFKGEDLFFSADGAFVLGSDLGEFALIPFQQSKKTPQFLGTFARSFGFSPNGEKALFLDGPKLISMSQDGEVNALYQGLGELQNAAFSQDSKNVFFSIFYLEKNLWALFKAPSGGEKFPAELPLTLQGAWDLDPLTEALVYECKAQSLCLYQDGIQDLNLSGSLAKWRP